MLISKKLCVVTALALSAIGLTGSSALSQELLSNGDFELGLVDVFPGWEFEEFLSNGNPAPINSAVPVGFANEPAVLPGEFGIWLRPFVGGVEAVGFDGANAILSQTVAASPGASYTLKGNSNFEQNYSGGVEFLDGLSPIGEQNGQTPQPSPTQSLFEIEFLDVNGSVIGTPASLDLVNDDFQFGGGGWLEHTLQGTAPAGTVEARVRLKAIDMVANIDPQQSAFYDNFSFEDDSLPGTDLLTNGGMNEFVQEVPSWEFTELPEGTNTAALAGFANNTPDGANGVWLRAFAQGDAIVGQTVAGTAGEEYTLTAASRWEENYSGGQAETGTETMLEIAFLDASEEVIGTPETLDLRTEQLNDNTWRTHSLTGTAPAGTAFVRIAGLATGMITTMGAQSAFFDDFSLTAGAVAGLSGDFNGDGVVDAADYTVWRANLGAGDESSLNGNGDGMGGVDEADFALWRSNYGSAAGSSASTAAVPEPSSVLLLAFAAGLALFRRNRC